MGVDRKKEKPDYEPLVAKGKPLETVSSVKVLGLHIRWDLVEYIKHTEKASNKERDC